MSDAATQHAKASAHLIELADAIYKICMAGGRINGASRHHSELLHNPLIKSDPSTRDELVVCNADIKSFSELFQKLIPIAKPLIPEADYWVRQQKQTAPATWATEMYSLLSQVASMVGLTGGHFTAEGSDEFAKLVNNLFQEQHYLRLLDCILCMGVCCMAQEVLDQRIVE